MQDVYRCLFAYLFVSMGICWTYLMGYHVYLEERTYPTILGGIEHRNLLFEAWDSRCFFERFTGREYLGDLLFAP